jgi:hypothetical protein
MTEPLRVGVALGVEVKDPCSLKLALPDFLLS